jgi:nucleoside-diphosphate-sugar epimerase
LITGGTGLIGSFLLDILAKKTDYENENCRVIVRNDENKTKIENQGFLTIKADLNDIKSLKVALKDVEVVFNLAAVASDWVGWNELYKVNVEGMRNLLEAILQSNTDPFLAHTSSTGVYGHFIPSTPIDENYKFNPTSIYQKSKYLQEKAIWDVQAKNGWDNFSIIRPPSIIGPRDKKTIIPIFKAVYEQKFPVLRKGLGYSTFIHPLDLCSALLLLYHKRNLSKGQVYNLKSFECRLIDFLNTIVDTINPPRLPKYRDYRLVYTAAILSEIYAKITGNFTTLNRYRVTKFALSRRYIDEKIKKQLGFTPQKSMRKTIIESYEWTVRHKLLPFLK